MLNVASDQVKEVEVAPVADSGLEPLAVRQALQIVEDSGLLSTATSGLRFPTQGRLKLMEMRRRWQDQNWRNSWGNEDFLSMAQS
jgi:hypothetical protein